MPKWTAEGRGGGLEEEWNDKSGREGGGKKRKGIERERREKAFNFGPVSPLHFANFSLLPETISCSPAQHGPSNATAQSTESRTHNKKATHDAVSMKGRRKGKSEELGFLFPPPEICHHQALIGGGPIIFPDPRKGRREGRRNPRLMS